MNKSLINCPDCGAYISRQARSCPKCGRLLLSLDFKTLQVIVQKHHKLNQIDSAIFTHKLIRTMEFINYEQMSIPEVRAKLRDIDMQIESLKAIRKEQRTNVKKELSELWHSPSSFKNFLYLIITIGILLTGVSILFIISNG